MNFKHQVKKVLENLSMREDQLVKTQDIVSQDDSFLKQTAAKIVDGLLKKHNNNPEQALLSLEKMTKNITDGFANKKEIEKAKQFLKNESKNKVKNNQLFIDDVYSNLMEAISINTGEKIERDPEKVSDFLLDNEINPGVYNPGLRMNALFYFKSNNINIPDFNEAYQIFGIAVQEKLLDKIMAGKIVFVPAAAHIEKNKELSVGSYKLMSPEQFKQYLSDIERGNDNKLTKLTLDAIKKYFSKTEIANKKREDLKRIRDALYKYAAEQVGEDLIKNYSGPMANEKLPLILDCMHKIRRNGIPEQFADWGLGIPKIIQMEISTPDDGVTAEEIVKFLGEYYNPEQDTINGGKWIKDATEKAKLIYERYTRIEDLYSNKPSVTDAIGPVEELLETLGINAYDNPTGEPYYWKQLIRNVGFTNDSIYRKRLSDYAPRDKNAKFKDTMVQHFDGSITFKENLLTPYLAFYLYFISDLSELKKIKEKKSETFKEFIIHNKIYDIQSPDFEEKFNNISETINIIHPLFMQYKILNLDKYKGHNDIEVDDNLAMDNFILFKNNIATKDLYKQIQDAAYEIDINIYNKHLGDNVRQERCIISNSFLWDTGDVFNPNNEEKSASIDVESRVLGNIGKNLKNIETVQFDTKRTEHINNITIPVMLHDMINAINLAIKKSSDVIMKNKCAHAFLTYLYMYTEKSIANYNFIDLYASIVDNNIKNKETDELYETIKRELHINNDTQFNLSEQIQQYYEDYGSTVLYGDAEYGLIGLGTNVDSPKTIEENNDDPIFIFHCLKNGEYEQDIYVKIENFYRFLSNAPLKRDSYTIASSLWNFKNKKLANKKNMDNKQTIEIKNPNSMYVILDKLNQIFDPERKDIWCRMLSLVHFQFGESLENIYNVAGIYYNPQIIYLEWPDSKNEDIDPVDRNVVFCDATTKEPLTDEQIKEIVPDNVIIKLKTSSKFFDTNQSTDKATKKLTTNKILLRDFIQAIANKDVENNEDDFDSFIDDLSGASQAFSVYTGVKKNDIDRMLDILNIMSQAGAFSGMIPDGYKGIGQDAIDYINSIDYGARKELQQIYFQLLRCNQTYSNLDKHAKHYKHRVTTQDIVTTTNAGHGQQVTPPQGRAIHSIIPQKNKRQ